MSAAADRQRVRRSAVRVGVLVAIASTLVILGGVGILIGVLLSTARMEHGHDGGRPDPDAMVVDLDRVLPWVVGLGIVGVVLLGVIGWLAARWAVRPLADALTLQRQFVSDASHELRTPLTALTSRIQILQRRHERGDAIATTLTQLRRDAAVMDDVLTDMLLSAEGDATGTQVAAVGDCVAAAGATVSVLAEEAGVRLVVDVVPADAAMPPVTLTRLCVALLDNAIQHAPAGSAVTISARLVPGVVEIRVADHGPGVPPEEQDRIFQRFARGSESGRRRGFGLGLALVREAADRAGGSISLEHTSPQGTTFLLRIPAV